MRCRVPAAVVMTATLFFAATSARAQQMDQDMSDMQQVMMTMMQRMQDANIDLQQIGQQVQDGTFDQQAFTQMLIDRHILDDDLMNKMMKSAIKLGLRQMQVQLASTDEEWVILGPKIQKLITAAMAMGAYGGVRMPMIGEIRATPVARAMAALETEIKDPSSNNSKLANKLAELRAATTKAKNDLRGAQEDLRGTLTLRQEAILMSLGLLD